MLLYFYRAPSGMTAGAEVIFGGDTQADAYAGRVVIGSSDLFELDVFDGPALSMKVRANVRSPPVTTEEVKMWRDDLRESGREIEGEFGTVIRAAIDRLQLRETPPAFQDLIVDSERFIWIAIPMRTPRNLSHWMVLAADGTSRRASGCFTRPRDTRDR